MFFFQVTSCLFLEYLKIFSWMPRAVCQILILNYFRRSKDERTSPRRAHGPEDPKHRVQRRIEMSSYDRPKLSSFIYKNGKSSFRRPESLNKEAFIHDHKLSNRIPVEDLKSSEKELFPIQMQGILPEDRKVFQKTRIFGTESFHEGPTYNVMQDDFFMKY